MHQGLEGLSLPTVLALNCTHAHISTHNTHTHTQIALVVHQGLEGLSLGTVLALTGFSRAKKVAMVALYAITTSVGESQLSHVMCS